MQTDLYNLLILSYISVCHENVARLLYATKTLSLPEAGLVCNSKALGNRQWMGDKAYIDEVARTQLLPRPTWLIWTIAHATVVISQIQLLLEDGRLSW